MMGDLFDLVGKPINELGGEIAMALNSPKSLADAKRLLIKLGVESHALNQVNPSDFDSLRTIALLSIAR